MSKHHDDETIGEKLDRIAFLLQAIVNKLSDRDAIADVRRDMAEERALGFSGRFYPPYSRAEAEEIHKGGEAE